MSDQPWLTRASALLAEDDPGPVPYLVDGVIVDESLCAVVGRWKTTKTYAKLDMAISIATGRPWLGLHAIPKPGPVIYVVEESGRAALWRRLDALARGRGIRADELGDLHVAPNQRVKLDEPDWQQRLIRTGLELQPRVFIFDPLARVKSPGRDENAQKEFAPVIEFMRELRDMTGAGVTFVAHTGHSDGDRIRGTSDLESVWESRLVFKRDGDAVSITSEHREAEPGPPIMYRLAWDDKTRTMRLRATVPPLLERILDDIAENGPANTDAIAKRIATRRSDVARVLRAASEAGTLHAGPSGRRDAAGRPIRETVWNLNQQAALWSVPNGDNGGTPHPKVTLGPVQRPTSLEVDAGRAT